MQVRTVNIKNRNSICHCSLFSKKNPVTRFFCLSGWHAVPINLDIWNSTVLEFPTLYVPTNHHHHRHVMLFRQQIIIIIIIIIIIR